MLNNKIQDALNAQINAEFWSAYLYLSMSMHFEAEGRAGIANWFAIQFKEEQAHAQIFMNYINQRGGRVVLKPIAEVPTQWESPLAAFEATLQHEIKVTALINELFALVRFGAGRRGGQLPSAHRQVQAYRRQRHGPLHARPGARSPHIYRSVGSRG